MIPVWPSDLPSPLRASYRSQRIDTRRQRRADGVPVPRQARRFSQAAREISLTLELDLEERGIFDRFYGETTADGIQPFYMTDPRIEGRKLLTTSGLPLLTNTGVPLLTTRRMLCVWGNEPPVEGAIRGLLQTITFSLFDMP